jgi:hypothetical protein
MVLEEEASEHNTTEMHTIQQDGNGQPYIQWENAPGSFRRVWVRRPTSPDKDYAGTGRYLSVVRTQTIDSGPGGNATDFPIYNDLSDEQVVEAFVACISAITGAKL